MQVWLKSIHLRRRYRGGKANFDSFLGLVTLKNSSRSPKSNQPFPPPNHVSKTAMVPPIERNFMSQGNYPSVTLWLGGTKFSSENTVLILFSASIISKKAAEMLDTLVLDVKVGRGAFNKDEAMARELASRMVRMSNTRHYENLPMQYTEISKGLGDLRPDFGLMR